jgi:hypothetical protein
MKIAENRSKNLEVIGSAFLNINPNFIGLVL